MKKQKTILIVEDDGLLREALVEKMFNEGFKVLEAADGESALEIISKNEIDIILLDIILPKMNGIEMLKKFREDKQKNDIPVIMLTNLSEANKIAESLEYGACGYFVKSDWSLDAIAKEVKKKLNL